MGQGQWARLQSLSLQQEHHRKGRNWPTLCLSVSRGENAKDRGNPMGLRANMLSAFDIYHTSSSYCRTHPSNDWAEVDDREFYFVLEKQGPLLL